MADKPVSSLDRRLLNLSADVQNSKAIASGLRRDASSPYGDAPEDFRQKQRRLAGMQESHSVEAQKALQTVQNEKSRKSQPTIHYKQLKGR